MKNFFIPTKKNNYKPYLLRKITLAFYSFVLVFVNSFGGVLGIPQASASSISPDAIIALTNEERNAAGLNTLNIDSRLSAAALAKAQNMFEVQYWDHFGPNGETPWQFIRAEGYYYVYAGENLAKGFKTAEGVHEAWMASPTHRANIMSANYKDIGVAVLDGVLLGKQTTLVVQMFGNLTSEVAGASVTPDTGSRTDTGDETVIIGDEQGEIKSIMITSPSQSSVTTDPGIDVVGSTENVSGAYTVEMYDGSELIGNTDSEEATWSFDKGSDWSEGDHAIQAQLKGENVKSETVTFSVDSTAPIVDQASISVVKQNEVYTLSFKIDSSWTSLKILNSSDTIDVTSEDKENISVSIPVGELGESVVIMATDVLGNFSQLDVAEYFPTEATESSNSRFVLSILNSDLGDKISVGIIAFIFILLCVEIFVYWRKGKLKEAFGDIFTVGAWWLVLTVAIFNGFTGLIN